MFEKQMFEMTQLSALKARQETLFQEMTRGTEMDETLKERLARRRFLRQFKYRAFFFRMAPRLAARMFL